MNDTTHSEHRLDSNIAFEAGWNALISYHRLDLNVLNSLEKLREFVRGFNDAAEALAEFLKEEESVKTNFQERLNRANEEINRIAAESGRKINLVYDEDRNSYVVRLLRDKSKAPKRLPDDIGLFDDMPF
jgi:hypothetical protein